MNNSYKFSVIVPILYLTDYSRKALRGICKKADRFKEIFFVFSCTETVVRELTEILGDTKYRFNIKIAPSIISASNHLRYNGLQYVITDYVYYQDCDDEVDYQVALESMNYCNGNNVVCFNIRKRVFNSNNQLVKDFRLYANQTGPIINIQNLPTNIVNKLIPLKMLRHIEYYNIPFTQDLSLSYQLFDKANHFFVNKEVYIYENNQLSTSGIKRTQYKSLLRVAAMERILVRLCSANQYNAAYISYRYEIILQSRFAYLGIKYCPTIAWKSFSIHYFGVKGVIRHLYHYAISYISCLNLLINCKNANTSTI